VLAYYNFQNPVGNIRGEAGMWEGWGVEPCTQKREVDSHPGWSSAFLEMQNIMHTTTLN